MLKKRLWTSEDLHSSLLLKPCLPSVSLLLSSARSPHLQSLEGVWKGLHPDEEGGDDDGRWVVGAVVTAFWQVSCRLTCVPSNKQPHNCWIKLKKFDKYLRPHFSPPLHICPWTSASFSPSAPPLASTGHGRLQDLRDRGSIMEQDASIKCKAKLKSPRERQKCVWSHFCLVVSEDPGEDWILHQIVVRAPSDCVQVHQILKVTYFSFLEENKRKLYLYVKNI